MRGAPAGDRHKLLRSHVAIAGLSAMHSITEIVGRAVYMARQIHDSEKEEIILHAVALREAEEKASREPSPLDRLAFALGGVEGGGRIQ